MTIPVTYRGQDGKQYVAVMASGSSFAPPMRGANGRPANQEALVAFALPE